MSIEVHRETPLYESSLQLTVLTSDNEYVRLITLRILSGKYTLLNDFS